MDIQSHSIFVTLLVVMNGANGFGGNVLRGKSPLLLSHTA